MWLLLKAVLKEEVSRIWRKLLRRPEPPAPYSQLRLRRGAALGPRDPDDPGHLSE